MQLTPLQLEIQQRSDKTLSFGCLFRYLNKNKQLENITTYHIFQCSGYRFIGRNHNRPQGQDGECGMKDKVFYNQGEYLCSADSRYIEIIGHPMTRGRLSYLGRVGGMSGEGEETKHAWVDMIIYKNPKVMEQTILDRPEDSQLLVKSFLDALPNETCNEE